jgi:phage shock protein E
LAAHSSENQLSEQLNRDRNLYAANGSYCDIRARFLPIRPKLTNPRTLTDRGGRKMPQGPRFEKLASQAKARIQEVTADDAATRQSSGARLIDVRETADFDKEHAKGAINLSKGVVEMKIEKEVPEIGAEIICYCGGGSRSALVADNLQKMGYENVWSMSGGFKAWKEAGLPTEA